MAKILWQKRGDFSLLLILRHFQRRNVNSRACFGGYTLKKEKQKERILPEYVTKLQGGRDGGGGGDNRATERHASIRYEVLQPFTTRNKSIKCQPLMEHVGEKKRSRKESPVCLVLLP